MREGSNHAGTRVPASAAGTVSESVGNGVPAYLAAPLGGDALLGSRGRESLGRDVQHPGPRDSGRVRVPPPDRIVWRNPSGHHRLLRLRGRAEAKPPTHFRGRQGSGAP